MDDWPSRNTNESRRKSADRPTPDKTAAHPTEWNGPDPLKGLSPRALGIIYSVCDQGGLSFDKVRNEDLDRPSAAIRTVAFALLRHATQMTQGEIGGVFNRSESDVKSARQHLQRLWHSDPRHPTCELLRTSCERVVLDPALVLRESSQTQVAAE
ncbi:hypothetical protein A3D71_04375 [Candidatus Kaiserbacteria bacterium RIFCSPHIGHO2_02_FULL_55_20]|uniref:Chromosomal replication initiator DnaA C-terminal domain-containing protein n=1 Tax=Candidatus Kaiserbacteria bacterium RIFCSPHIGHO2_02_FULL_55_20 TaxID=1798497 RepID=A0A1F6DUY7_9BACT|nr:MAG: hypothetical protein A2680_03795 [Candidatus Kaiserbacteria bacterium RIFCSPHIGHO2_01_FULL_55_37]OGG65255.1 MAG: hypothetical protein A3D71_04375 [Candidatus Kaiserbacteria bacterium RIFCSPHIGHO2_02_FULL_55_20]